MSKSFNIQGIDFVSGLLWQPMAGNTASDRRKEFKLLSNELQSDLFVFGDSTVLSVGFGKTKDNIKDGMTSAAMIVSHGIQKDKDVQNFIFVDQLPDGQWLYICQRHSVIIPDGDQVFSSEDAARAQVLQELETGSWEVISTPELWGLSSIHLSFNDLIPRKPNGKVDIKSIYKISNLNASAQVTKHFGKIVIFLAVIFGSVFFYVQYKKEQEQKAIEEAQRLAAEAAAQNQAVKLEHPWKKEPLASEILNSCVLTMKKVILFPGNWDIDAINCDQSNFTIAWKAKSGGWIAHLRAISPAIEISPDGSSASLTIPFENLKTGFDEEVGKSNPRLLDMLSAAQKYGVKLSAKPVASNQNTLPGQAPVESTSKDWEEIDWRAEDVLLPEVVLKALEGNGFRMSSLRANWSSGQFVWTMEGKQYVH